MAWAPHVPDHPAEWSRIQTFDTLFVFDDRLYFGAGLPSGESASIWEQSPQGDWRKVGGDGMLASIWHDGMKEQTTQWYTR